MQELYLSKKQLPFVIVIDKIESKPKKGKTCVFKTFVNKCHEHWKKNPKTTYSLSYHLQNKKIKSQDLFKKYQNWSKTDQTDQKIDQNWSETYVISKSFLSFLFPPKNNAFLQVIFMKSENHFGVLKKNMLESSQ